MILDLIEYHFQLYISQQLELTRFEVWEQNQN